VHSATHEAISAVWRIESARIVATVARMVRDIGLAEELAQDALVAALEHWPRDGVPDNPAAWLVTTAKRKALDHLRHLKMRGEKLEELGHDLEAQEALVVPDFVDALDAARQDDIGDDLLRLIFTACHPVLSTDARVALTLRLLGGLTTHEIARAYLVPEPTIAQRIVRAKRTLSEAKVPFELPRADALADRLASVLEVVYLVFNEGYTATAGEDWMRPALTQEALRLGRMLAELAPTEPEAHGLAALMELQASRSAARVDAAGRPVLLMAQDRARWDRLLIRRGLAALQQAQSLCQAAGPAHGNLCAAGSHCRLPRQRAHGRRHRLGAHCRAVRRAGADRAVARGGAQPRRGRGHGVWPAAGLQIIDALQRDKALGNYHWLPSVRGDLLAKLGRHEEARAEFMRAAELAHNERERELLMERAQRIAD
jgi:RNA polymerase sigma factor (sigma-70 family)